MTTPAQYSFIKVVSTSVHEAPHIECNTPNAIVEYWKNELPKHPSFEPDKEMLFVFCLDTKLKIKHVNLVSLGCLNESTAHPREIFRPAIAVGCYAIIISHNHPSGDPTPSDADRRLTTRLKEAGSLLQMPLMDHVIMGNEKHFSFRESGLL